MKFKKPTFGKYFFDFVSVFFAVIAAFGLNNWNENRRDAVAEEKVLIEIKNGLQLDLEDFNANRRGHKKGLTSIAYFYKILADSVVSKDSLMYHYFFLTGDNTSVMNTSGYEGLKSKGLEIIKNDFLRSQIVAVYENDYQILTSYEERSPMYQHFKNYFLPIDTMLSEYFVFNDRGIIVDLQPLKLTLQAKNSFLSYLFRLRSSRLAKLDEYDRVEGKVQTLLKDIERELESR